MSVYTGWLMLRSALSSRSRNTMGVTATIILHDIEPSFGEKQICPFFPPFPRTRRGEPPSTTHCWVDDKYIYPVFIITVTFTVNRLSNVLWDGSTLPPPALKMDAMPSRGIVYNNAYRCTTLVFSNSIGRSKIGNTKCYYYMEIKNLHFWNFRNILYTTPIIKGMYSCVELACSIPRLWCTHYMFLICVK